MKDYGTEEKCRKARFKWRGPKGYVCPLSAGLKVTARLDHGLLFNVIAVTTNIPWPVALFFPQPSSR